MERLSVEYGDGWGAATCALGLALVDLCNGTASAECARAAERAALAYDALGAHVPALWARAARATLLARLGNTEAFRVAQHVVDDSSRVGPRWALAVASQVLAADPSTTASVASAYGHHAGTLARELGVRLPSLGRAFSLPETPSRGAHPERSAQTRDTSAPGFGHRATDRAESGTGGVWPDDERNRETLAGAPVGVRCLGGFELWIAGTRLDLDGLKPRFRALLRLLASRAGQSVHKGELAFSLWPDADEAAAARNVNVAISAIRQSIEPGSPRGASSIVGRDHEAYFFRAPEHTVIDHMELSAFARRAREASAAGDVRASITAFARSLTWYGGDLLPNDGSAEWVSKDRERLRLEAADVAQSLAELLLRTGDVSSAAHAAERGLQIDRFRDGLWRVLIDALNADDRRAEAERSRRRYADTLAELGLS
jgi:DNA-binding SARP family transcriptional activator